MEEIIRKYIENKENYEKDANSLKQAYIHFVDDGRKMSKVQMENLLTKIMEKYPDICEIKNINVLIQKMLEEYKKIENMDKEFLDNVSCNILGHNGVKIGRIGDTEKVNQLLKMRLENKPVIDNNVINVLEEESKRMYPDTDNYKKMAYEIIMENIDNPNSEVQITTKKVYNVLEKLAKLYKYEQTQRELEGGKETKASKENTEKWKNGGYDRIFEIYEKGMKLEAFKDTEEFKEFETSYEEFKEFHSRMNDLEDVHFNSFEELLRTLEVKFIDNKPFESKSSNLRNSNHANNRYVNNKNVMSEAKKLEQLVEFMKILKDQDPKYDIKSAKIGKDSYEGYVILNIEESDVCILENFKTDQNEAIYIIPKDDIQKVAILSKRETRQINGVEVINHTENGYAEKLAQKVLGININKTKSKETKKESPQIVKFRDRQKKVKSTKNKKDGNKDNIPEDNDIEENYEEVSEENKLDTIAQVNKLMKACKGAEEAIEKLKKAREDQAQEK